MSGSAGKATSWEDIDCNILCRIAHTGLIQVARMRLTCKTWRRELDLCMFDVEPALCDIPQIAQLFPNVRRLDLSACNLTVRDDNLERLTCLQQLTMLDLRGCARVSAEGVKQLSGCRSLADLRLGREPPPAPGDEETTFDSKITDNVLEALLSISQLKAIRIGYSCKFTMQGVLGLTQMTNLEQLHVMGHSTQDFGHFSADDISKLQSLKKLTSLSIGVVPAEAFKSLPCMSRLTNLDLYGDTWERMHLSLGDIAFLQYLTKVQHLGFHHYELEDDASQYMGEKPEERHFLHCLSRLESLAFDDCQIAPGCEVLLLHCCRRIKKLHINLVREDMEDDEAYIPEEMQNTILKAIESTPEWAVKDLVMYGAAAFPNYARATLSRAPSLQSLKWDSDKARGEEGFVWHELGVSRWKCAASLLVIHLGKRVRLWSSEVENMTAFRQLKELSCYLEDAIPQAIQKMSSLKSLCISWRSGGNKGLEVLGRLTGLEKLEVSCQDCITDEGLFHLQGLMSLTGLVFRSNEREPQIEGHGLRSLGALEGLVKLELVSSQIMQAKDLRYLSRLTHLRHLDTGTFEYITNDVLQALEPLIQLRRLWIRIPKMQLWRVNTKTIQLSKEDLVRVATAHPVLTWVCFGNHQMMSLPEATVDRELLEKLQEAERSGSLDSIDEPFWLSDVPSD